MRPRAVLGVNAIGRRRPLLSGVLMALAISACSNAGAADDGSGNGTPRSPVSPQTALSRPAPPPVLSSTAATPATSSATPATEPATGTAPAPDTFSESVAHLAKGVSDEASGVAVSSRTPNAFFLVDDATGTGDIVAVDAKGTLLTRMPVSGMSAANAEALSSGPCGTTPLPGAPASDCLYVGDIGDNNSRRDDIAVYRLAEPDIRGASGSGADDPLPADEWHYTYPDGPHNAEGMIIDTDGSVLVVTKPGRAGSPPHRMYRGAPGGGELVLVREFRPPDAQRPLRTMFTGNVVTDLATAPGRVLLLTYDEVQEYKAPKADAPLSSFPDWPHRRLPLGGLPQAEGVASAADGCGYVVASEGGPGGGNGSLAVVTCR